MDDAAGQTAHVVACVGGVLVDVGGEDAPAGAVDEPLECGAVLGKPVLEMKGECIVFHGLVCGDRNLKLAKKGRQARRAAP